MGVPFTLTNWKRVPEAEPSKMWIFLANFCVFLTANQKWSIPFSFCTSNKIYRLPTMMEVRDTHAHSLSSLRSHISTKGELKMHSHTLFRFLSLPEYWKSSISLNLLGGTLNWLGLATPHPPSYSNLRLSYPRYLLIRWPMRKSHIFQGSSKEGGIL